MSSTIKKWKQIGFVTNDVVRCFQSKHSFGIICKESIQFFIPSSNSWAPIDLPEAVLSSNLFGGRPEEVAYNDHENLLYVAYRDINSYILEVSAWNLKEKKIKTWTKLKNRCPRLEKISNKLEVVNYQEERKIDLKCKEPMCLNAATKVTHVQLGYKSHVTVQKDEFIIFFGGGTIQVLKVETWTLSTCSLKCPGTAVQAAVFMDQKQQSVITSGFFRDSWKDESLSEVVYMPDELLDLIQCYYTFDFLETIHLFYRYIHYTMEVKDILNNTNF